MNNFVCQPWSSNHYFAPCVPPGFLAGSGCQQARDSYQNSLAAALQEEKQKTQYLTINLYNRDALLERKTAENNNLANNLDIVVQKGNDLALENQHYMAENLKLLKSLKDMKIKCAADFQEFSKVKRLSSKMEDELIGLKYELAQQEERAKALNVINEMLLIGNEKRDETIAEYKKKLQKYVSLSSFSDSDIQVENIQPIQVSGNKSIDSSSQDAASLQQRDVGGKACDALLGPWRCVVCGTNESFINFETYPEFRQHLIDVHQEAIDPALCKLCGWRSSSNVLLDSHMYKAHNVHTDF